MASQDLPYGTFPLVFESGVINIDEEGILHIHLSHGPETPHPLVTHPDGEETNIPGNVSEANLVGNENETTVVRCGLKETDDLPTGFVFHLKGWKLLQLELSGDLTVVMAGMKDVPEWFQHGKIHRFDGPENGVHLFSGSQPLVEREQQQDPLPKPPRPPKPQQNSPKKPSQNTQTKSDPTPQSTTGCGLLLFIGAVITSASMAAAPLFM